MGELFGREEEARVSQLGGWVCELFGREEEARVSQLGEQVCELFWREEEAKLGGGCVSCLGGRKRLGLVS